MTIGERIRALRMERNWSQLQLAILIGTRPERISYIERGTKPATVWQIGHLAEVFGLPVEGLLRPVDGLWDRPAPVVLPPEPRTVAGEAPSPS